MARVQLALNVSDLEAAVVFYSTLFGVEPAKRRPGYANFAVASPPLKLILIEASDARMSGVTGALNHLGIEMEAPEEVEEAARRLAAEGLNPDLQRSTTCCYAVQDKAWVSDPDGAPWEVYAVLADAPGANMGCSPQACAPVDGVPVAAGAPVRTTAAGPCC